MKMLYCIKHDQMVEQERTWNTVNVTHPDGVADERAIETGYVHDFLVYPDNIPELEWCEFDCGWATCPPPQEHPDWIKYVEDISDEELGVINENAVLLIADYGLL